MPTITCARCAVCTSPGRYCLSCEVFLCGACARKGKCPADGRDLRKTTGLWMFLFILGAAFFGFAAFGLAFELQSYERAGIPTTAIADLVPKTMGKINGTIEASSPVAIEPRGSGDDHYWVLIPFNLTDATGSVYVDVTQVQGSTSFWVIERGRHGGDWWDGDAASIIGDVTVFSNGTTYIVARFVSWTPDGFAGNGVPPMVFASVATAAAIPGTIGLVRFRRRLASHRSNFATYLARVQDWRACGECRELVTSDAKTCPSCNATVPRPSRALESLPTLQLVSAFGQLSRKERAAAVALAIVLPPILGAAFLWIAHGIGLERSLQPALLLLPIFAIIMPLVTVPRFFVPHRITLSPERIVSRRMRHDSVLAGEIDCALTIRKGSRQAHMLITRGEQVLGFGPGLAPADFEASRAWIRNLAEALGIRYRENVTLAEAILFIRHRAQ